MSISHDVLNTTSEWIPRLSVMWRQEVPMRLHSRDLADDGTLQWSRDFSHWMSGRRESDQRSRLSSAMRKLRRKSIREFEVAYRIIVLGEQIEGTCAWLNSRAESNGLADRYSLKDTQVILVGAVDKLVHWA